MTYAYAALTMFNVIPFHMFVVAPFGYGHVVNHLTMPTRSTLFTTMIFKTFYHFFTNNTANDILFVQPDLLRKIHSYPELTLINLETHIYETKPKTTPTRFNKI